MLAWQIAHVRRDGAVISEGEIYRVYADLPVRPAFVSLSRKRALSVVSIFGSVTVEDAAFSGILEREKQILRVQDRTLRNQRDWLREGQNLGVDTASLVDIIDRRRAEILIVRQELRRVRSDWDTLLLGGSPSSRWWIRRAVPIFPERLLTLWDLASEERRRVRVKTQGVPVTDERLKESALRLMLEQDPGAIGEAVPLVLGIDPGQTTGFALCRGSEVLWTATAQGDKEVWTTLAALFREHGLGPPDGFPVRAVVERAVNFQFINKERVATIQAEGTSTLFLHLLEIPYKYQTSSQIGAYSMSRLKALTGSEFKTRHMADACAHALYSQGIFTPKGGEA